ncbi:MAG TPA: hypothetical protein VJA47_05725 [archaeon]|nr:hypothetical protein [archaeon]
MAKSEENPLEELFLREKPAKIFLGLKTSKEKAIYATLLSKYADCTFSHTIKILNVLQKLGLVEFEKTGRIKTVKLTDDGWDVAHNLEAIMKKFDQLQEKMSAAEKAEKPAKK